MGDFQDWLSFCQVGSGSTLPSASDSSLVNRLASTNVSNTTEAGKATEAPYFCYRRKTFRFAEGAAAGNLSEVGVGWASTGSLYSRELILDGSGDPTTITVLADEILDVTYEKRQYMPAVDSSGVITLDGVDYAYVGRASNVTIANDTTGWQIPVAGISAGLVPPAFAHRAYEGTIGGVLSEPSGAADAPTSSTALAYVANSKQRSWTLLWNNNQANFATGIRSVRTKCGIGNYQLGFTPAIPKDLTKVLSLTFQHSWARRP